MECRLPPRPEDLYVPSGDTRGGGATPPILLGDPITGVGGDSTRTAFAKFNVHDHARASSNRFDTSGIQAGDLFEMAAHGTRLFPVGTRVQQVQSEQLILSEPALYNGDAPALVYGSLTLRVPNLRACKDSPIVTRLETAGMLEGSWVETLASLPLSRSIESPTPELYSLCLWLPFRAVLSQMWAKLRSGRLLLSPWANGLPLGEELDVNPALSHRAYSWPILPPGSHVQVRVANPTAAKNLDVTLVLHRVLS